MAATKVALILGAGPRVGAAVSSALASAGYSIAMASRSGNSANPEHLTLKADLSDPSVVPGLFDAVEAHFHAPPSVIVYNAASLTPPAVEGNLLSIPEARVVNDLKVNVVSPFIAAQEAVKHWDKAGPAQGRVFIYTGNAQNTQVVPMPMLLNLGVGKSGSAYWIAQADASYKDKGYRFLYADERQENGGFSGAKLAGDSAGSFYSHVAKTGAKDIPWHATFVKDKGYVKF